MLILLALVAVVVYGLDQLVKAWVVAEMELYETIPLLGEVLQLHYVTNPGAAFSLASGFTWILSAIALGVVAFVVWFSRRIRSIGWGVMFGLVLGGALGNLTDRLTRPPGFPEGHVVDYIQVIYFPAIFNIADIAIVSSMGLFILLTIRGVRLDGTRLGRDPEPAGGGAAAEAPEPGADER
ncbi:signal peptidase II [Homoserinibacter sp. YIM 151385]|uniref:signal peptidase II n=1 Tax=Homoserinibacter sp. YIM 151385 TaxID=2985506 RepID=UPI0022F0FFF3|nr:signal peptidase II [Homoserinibacter sp. YIM 151385]WBU38733.1 signal peptidase II [Homoserinibacter sp. YIM 151385]